MVASLIYFLPKLFLGHFWGPSINHVDNFSDILGPPPSIHDIPGQFYSPIYIIKEFVWLSACLYVTQLKYKL